MTDRKQALIDLRDKAQAGKSGLGTAFVFYREEAINASRAYLGSLDAAKALHEAVLPGAFWNMGQLDEPGLGYVATVAQGHFPDSPSWRGFAQDPARAWLLAILEALIAQGDVK